MLVVGTVENGGDGYAFVQLPHDRAVVEPVAVSVKLHPVAFGLAALGVERLDHALCDAAVGGVARALPVFDDGSRGRATVAEPEA